MAQSIERIEKVLDKIEDLHAKAINHAVISTVFLGAMVNHPRAYLEAIRTRGIADVYREVYNANTDLLYSKE